MARSASTLFEKVAFDEPVQQSDGQGGVVRGWDEKFSCRAHYRYLRGGETVQAARLEGKQPVIVTIRSALASREVTTDWRIRDLRTGTFDSDENWTGDVYNVRAINPTEDRRFIELLAEKGVAV